MTVNRSNARNYSPLCYLAKQQIQRSSKFTYLLSLLLPKPDRQYFRMWYSYLRWIDDCVDNMPQSLERGCCLIDRQLELIDLLYKGQIPVLQGYEDFLAALISHDRERGSSLKCHLRDMLDAIKFDLLHAGEAIEYSELQNNYEREVLSYLGTLAYFCRLEPKLPRPPGASAAIGAKLVHILRDFIPDFANGRFNISRQELAAYNLRLQEIPDQIDSVGLRRWVVTKARIAGTLLNEGLHEACTCPSLRYRLMVAILVGKYQTHLDRLRTYHFVLRAPDRISFSAFLFNVAKNVASALFSKEVNRARASSPPRPISRLLPIAAKDKFALIWTLHPWTNAKASSELLNAMCNVHVARIEMSKMRRRFAIAYRLGRDSFKFVNQSSSPANLSHGAGLLYGYWALSIIELDRLVDHGEISDSFVETLCDDWLRNIHRAVEPHNPSPIGYPYPLACDGLKEADPQIANAFFVLASHFTRQVAWYRGHVRRTDNDCICSHEFLAQARSFIAAQLFSREQKFERVAHDWKWYSTKLLNQKTLGFFLAPLPLWCLGEQDRDRLQILIDKFLTLNEGYLHWQLLDDIADMENDTTDGLITAPGYILLSQGALARTWLDGTVSQERFDNEHLSTVKSAALGSMLVCKWFRDSPLLDGHRHALETALHDNAIQLPSMVTIIHCALANVADELRMSLPELCMLRTSQARLYAEAMKSRNGHAARRYLCSSRTVKRIMLAVHDEARTTTASIHLTSGMDKPLLNVLRTLELLMARACSKATRVTFQGCLR